MIGLLGLLWRGTRLYRVILGDIVGGGGGKNGWEAAWGWLLLCCRALTISKGAKGIYCIYKLADSP